MKPLPEPSTPGSAGVPPAPLNPETAARTDRPLDHPPADAPAPPPPELPCKGRSKISMLSSEILEELNIRLQKHNTLKSISNWLAAHGHSDISVENLFHYKHHGFRDWIEEQDRIEQISALRQWAAEAARDGAAHDMPTAVASFITARLYGLLRTVDMPRLQRFLDKDPKQFVHYIDRLIRASRLSIKALEVRQILEAAQIREDGVITPERLHQIEEALRLL